jgi:hypothetical protein
MSREQEEKAGLLPPRRGVGSWLQTHLTYKAFTLFTAPALIHSQDSVEKAIVFSYLFLLYLPEKILLDCL